MELYIFNQDDELLTILSEDNGLLRAPFRDELNRIADEPLSFTVDVSIDYEQFYDDNNNLTQVAGSFIGTLGGASVKETVNSAKFIEEENRVVFRDREGKLREFIIKEIDDINSETAESTAICLPAWVVELSENYILDRRFDDKEAQEAMTAATEGTRYVGIVEGNFGLASTNFYRLSSVDCIFKIRDTWGGDISDEVVLNEKGRIAERRVIIKQRLGSDKGLRFDVDYNINKIQRTILSYPKTAIYGYGASLETDGGGHTRYIDFSDVEWSVTDGDPVDKPLGQKWVGDPEALQRLGRNHGGKLLHRFGEFGDHTIDNGEELLTAAWEYLQRAKHPEINYRLDVDLLDKGAELGDTAVAIDRVFARPIELQSRVIAIEYDLLDIDGTAIVEMGEFLDIADYRLDRIIDTIDRNIGRWEHPRIDDSNFSDEKPDVPTGFSAIAGYANVSLMWNFVNTSKIAAYELYASEIADFVPDEQHLIWRGQSGGYLHETEVNKTWYYYLRAVNHHGTPSEFSARANATTLRINADTDIDEHTITKRLLALEAIIDSIHIGDEQVLSSHIRNLRWDKAIGGIATLGGPDNGFGRLQVLDDEGEIIADLDAEYGGFAELLIGKLLVTEKLEAPGLVEQTDRDITYQIRGTAGDDDNEGESFSEPLFSVNEAIKRLPKIINHDIVLRVSNPYDISENITFDGFFGSGSITLDLRGLTFNGYIRILNCSVRVNLRDGNVSRDRGTTYVIQNQSSDFVDIQGIIVNGNDHADGIITSRGGNTYIVGGTEAYNVKSCYTATHMSRITVNARGIGEDYGVNIVNGSILHCGANGPTGNISDSFVDSSSEKIGSFGNLIKPPEKPKPPPIVERTETWTATSSADWSSRGWNTTNRKTPHQGAYQQWGPYRGLWFFGSGMRNTIRNKTIKRIRVRAERVSGAGNSGNVPVVFRAHQYSSQPSGTPSLSSTSHTVNFKWGERKWFTLPSSFHSLFSGGNYYGIGIQTNTNSHYAVMTGNLIIEVTYDD